MIIHANPYDCIPQEYCKNLQMSHVFMVDD